MPGSFGAPLVVLGQSLRLTPGVVGDEAVVFLFVALLLVTKSLCCLFQLLR